jgi:hypothetical protein
MDGRADTAAPLAAHSCGQPGHTWPSPHSWASPPPAARVWGSPMAQVAQAECGQRSGLLKGRKQEKGPWWRWHPCPGLPCPQEARDLCAPRATAAPTASVAKRAVMAELEMSQGERG